MAGRPRGVDDAVILRAAVEVMGRVGPAGLTLAAVAGEVGLVPATLVQRFGSKRGLLVALAEHSVREAEARYGELSAEHTSPLAALTALAVDSTAAMETPDGYANHLAFLCADLTDPTLREHALAVHRKQREALERLLAEAVAAGELRAGTDPAALAGSVQAVVAGAGLAWALDREGTLPQRIEREIDTLLSPRTPSWGGTETEGS
ncbi:TetR/AcrR family transcriptional regulator [Kitasatospora sp. NPDC058406]|uniref:TetR/AcrR family transcriptional regulator n=1 Tax=Kitasatospora sp. NPDC058406 TaxID=3346483 RepID=UPI00365B103A